MKLIYIWVNEYKKIKKSGFNLDAEYLCGYDPNTHNFSFSRNKNYTSVFHNRNISNIFAFVGKNGSGKTSIMELILYLFNNFDGNVLNRPFFFNGKNQQCFYVFLDENETPLIIDYTDNGVKYNGKKYNGNSEIKNAILKLQNNIFAIYANFTTEMPGSRFYNKLENGYSNENYTQNFILIPSKKDGCIDRFRFDKIVNRKMLDLLSEENNELSEIFKDFFIPNLVQLKLNCNRVKLHEIHEVVPIHEMYGRELQKARVGWESFIDRFDKLIPVLDFAKDNYQENLKIIQSAHLFKLILYECSRQWNQSSFDIMDNYFSFRRYIIDGKELAKEDIIKFGKTSKRHKIKILNALQHPDRAGRLIANEFSDEFNKSVCIFDKIALFFDKALTNDTKQRKSFDSFEFNIDVMNENRGFFVNLPNWIEIEYLEDGQPPKAFSSLSEGERSIYSQLLLINSNLKKLNQARNTCKNIILLLDQTDLGLHPEWQRQYLDLLTNTIGYKDIKIQLIIATHSPFLASDLPEENILFLDNGKNIKFSKPTFGANIHELLYDSFFLPDTLIGEIANKTINNILKFCDDIIEADNNNKSELVKVKKDEYLSEICLNLTKKEYFRKIQSIIGEKYIKIIIKNNLEEVENIFRLINTSELS